MGINVLLHGDGGQSFFDFPNQVVQQNLMGVVALAPDPNLFWGGGSGANRVDGVPHSAAVNALILEVWHETKRRRISLSASGTPKGYSLQPIPDVFHRCKWWLLTALWLLRSGVYVSIQNWGPLQLRCSPTSSPFQGRCCHDWCHYHSLAKYKTRACPHSTATSTSHHCIREPCHSGRACCLSDQCIANG